MPSVFVSFYLFQIGFSIRGAWGVGFGLKFQEKNKIKKIYKVCKKLKVSSELGSNKSWIGNYGIFMVFIGNMWSRLDCQSCN